MQFTGEAFSPHEKTSSSKKFKLINFFSIFVGHFCPPSGYGSRDTIDSWSGSKNTGFSDF